MTDVEEKATCPCCGQERPREEIRTVNGMHWSLVNELYKRAMEEAEIPNNPNAMAQIYMALEAIKPFVI